MEKIRIRFICFFNGDTKQGDSLSADIKDGKFYFKGTLSTLPILAQFHFSKASTLMQVYIAGPKTLIDCTDKFSRSNGAILFAY